LKPYPRTLALGALLAFAACAAPPAPKPPAPSERVLAIADAVVDARLEEYPERATQMRVPGIRYDGLPDDSLAAVEQRARRRTDWLTELRGIDAATLQDPALLAHQIALARLADEDAVEVCRYPLWDVDQMGGWQVRFAELAHAQPVESAELRAQAMKRFALIPAYADTQIDNLRAGLAQGYSAARVNVAQVIGQLDRVLGAPLEESPFYSPAKRGGDPAFAADFGALVRDQIHPALARYRDFLRDEYQARARSEVAVAANPDGAACYRAALRYSTTLPLDPEAVHEEGLRQLAALRDEMQEIARRSFGDAPLPKLLQRFKNDPKYRYRDADEMMRRARVAIVRAQAALPRAFGFLPTRPCEIEPIPAYQERTAAPHYVPAALDGSRPATYRIRLYQASQQSWVVGESTAFHEVVPGHHLQINVANNRHGLPRIARFLFNSGFSEGWALYAERLADELGLYSSDADRMGMLSNFSWRAARMVVDTGLHAEGWSRQEAIDLLLENTALGPEQAAQEVDRYIVWPGQAPSYMVGYLEITDLRRQAEARLGADFSLRSFHDGVLINGNVPLPVLRERVGGRAA